VGRTPTMEVLISPVSHAKLKREIRDEEERKFKSSCTFKPRTNPANLYVSSSGYNEAHPVTLMEDINSRKADKLAKLSLAKKQIEAEEMIECTFHPQIISKPKNLKKPVFIRGIKEFMERKEYAEKLEKQKIKRANRAFNVDINIVKMRKRGRCTKPKPFTFQTQILNGGNFKKSKQYQIVHEARSKDNSRGKF
jgi:hypothetical protein